MDSRSRSSALPGDRPVAAQISEPRSPGDAGASDEGEAIRPWRVSLDTAPAALEAGKLHNGNLILALQWLALHRRGLDRFLAAAA
jgi:ADP-ribose pyrophosphatase